MQQNIIRTNKNGKEGFFFQKDELIIRDLSFDDIDAFIEILKNLVNVNEEDEKKYLLNLISQRNIEKDDKFVLLVTSSKDNEIIGFLKFNMIPESHYCDTEIRGYLKDPRTIQEEGSNVLKAISFIHEEYGLFDQIYLIDDEDNRVNIKQIIA